ncbi:hypothetical protein Rcae01_05959 [Novipirellula caenicola]|uniref:Uncharacterized protein n=1 Tax=Novipirellula caenicola TaxID=1536901 RepID=A0ABP9VZ98_9BACT
MLAPSTSPMASKCLHCIHLLSGTIATTLARPRVPTTDALLRSTAVLRCGFFCFSLHCKSLPSDWACVRTPNIGKLSTLERRRHLPSTPKSTKSLSAAVTHVDEVRANAGTTFVAASCKLSGCGERNVRNYRTALAKPPETFIDLLNQMSSLAFRFVALVATKRLEQLERYRSACQSNSDVNELHQSITKPVRRR